MNVRKIVMLAALCGLAALAAQAGDKKITLGLGHGQALTSAMHVSLTKMADDLRQRTDGAIEIQIFPANQLGNERDLAEGLQQGIIDMAWVSTAVMENFDSKFSMFSLPYVFKSYDHVAAVVNSDIGEYVFSSLLKTQNIRVLGFFDQGFRCVWNNVRSIRTAEDIKGLKIRSPESPVYMGTFRLLGANPTPIPWGEVYTAMQTKVVAGFESSPESFIVAGMTEVAKYASRTHHIYAGSVLMIREELWQGLTDAQRALIAEEVAKAVAANRALILANEDGFFKTMKDKGMVLNDVADAEMDRFAKVVEPLYKEYAARLGSDDIIARARAMYKK